LWAPINDLYTTAKFDMLRKEVGGVSPGVSNVPYIKGATDARTV